MPVLPVALLLPPIGRPADPLAPARPRRRLLAAGASLTVAGTAGGVRAAGPGETLRLVVPFPPGGSTDLLARRFVEPLRAHFGGTVLVENRPGAGGMIAAEHVARSAPDGQTLLVGVTGTNAVAASLYRRLSFDPVNDLTPISLLVRAPLVVVVNDSLPVTDLTGFVAAARARPGQITHGSPGNGTSMHLAGEMLAMTLGLRLNHVPYKGSGPALQDFLGGQIHAMFGDLLVLLPHIRDGRARALAVTSRDRHPLLPAVPAVAETRSPDGGGDLAGFEALSWQGLFAPAATPAARIDALNAAIRDIAADAGIQSFFAERGFVVATGPAPAARDFVRSEAAKWGHIVRATGVAAD